MSRTRRRTRTKHNPLKGLSAGIKRLKKSLMPHVRSAQKTFDTFFPPPKVPRKRYRRAK